MRAALGARHRMDLVDNDRARTAEHPASAHTRQQNVQRLGRRDQDVRSLAQHPGARRRRRVARAHPDSDLREFLPLRFEARAQLGERLLEVALHVVAERLERRDVENLDGVRKRRLESAHDELVQLPHERRERFSCPRWSEDQRMLAARDRRPPQPLRLARRPESFGKPRANDRMERGERS